MHLCQSSAALLLQCSPGRAAGSQRGRTGHLSPYAGIAHGNAVPAHRRHPGAYHRECRDGDTRGGAGVLLSDRREDQALLRALLVPVRCDRSALGVVLILLNDRLRLGDSVT